MARIHEHTVNVAAPLSLVNAIPLAMQGDAEADELRLHVVKGKEQADMTGYAVGGYLERADGIRVMLKGSVTADTVEVKLQEACYRAPGAYKAFVRLTKTTGEKMTLFLFAGYIEGEGDGEIVDEEDTLPSVEELIAMIEDIDRAIKGADAAAASADAAAAEALKAAENAGRAEKAANDAADEANAAADAADEAAVGASAWAKATMEAESLPEGSTPTVAVEKNESGGNVIRVGIPAGRTGEAGVTPQITFEVETGAAGSDAKLEQSGTEEAPHIKLTIPRGDTGAADGVDYYEGEPEPLGEASPGTSNGLARGNHVHPMPTAEDVGARPNTWTPTAEDVGARPNTWTPTAEEVGARPNTWTPTAEEVGALHSDGTAVNANALNGKNAEYYTNPFNLLRNSNFRDPVNTVGFSSGSTAGAWAGETINEWLAYASGATITLTSSGMSLLNGIYQEMSSVDLSRCAGKNLTFAAKINGVVYAGQGVVNQTGAWHILGESATPYGHVRTEIQNDNKLFCIIVNNTEAVVEWAALYEGAYTSDNVPPPFIYSKRLEMLNLGIPVQPVNLLDNSDFTNPVNQRGFKTCTEAWTYTIDRWISGSVGTELTDGGIKIINGGWFYQNLDYKLYQKYLANGWTAAVWLADGTLTILNSAGLYINSGGCFVEIVTENAASGYFTFRISASWEHTPVVKCCALYPGVYTADNLPPYVPKENELATCLSRFVSLEAKQNGASWLAFGLAYSATSARFLVLLPSVMDDSAVPSVTFDNLQILAILNGETVSKQISNITCYNISKNAAYIVANTSELATGALCVLQTKATGAYLRFSRDL